MAQRCERAGSAKPAQLEQAWLSSYEYIKARRSGFISGRPLWSGPPLKTLVSRIILFITFAHLQTAHFTDYTYFPFEFSPFPQLIVEAELQSTNHGLSKPKLLQIRTQIFNAHSCTALLMPRVPIALSVQALLSRSVASVA